MYEYAQYSSMLLVPLLVGISLLMVVHEIKKEKKREAQKRADQLSEIKRQLDLATKDWRDRVKPTSEMKSSLREQNDSPEILRPYFRTMRRNALNVRRVVTSQTPPYPDLKTRRVH